MGEVSVGGVNQDIGEQEVRRITNVAADSAPTDAVNVSQLQNQMQNVRYDVDNRLKALARTRRVCRHRRCYGKPAATDQTR